MGKPGSHWIVILQPVSCALAYRYDPWYRADAQRPVDVITDVVNDLGVKLLQQYSTHGNVAFSPTGVAFVLAALYEGSAGRGSQQIFEAIGLPANRDVTRIGFRDIHRRLRTYLNADGFLGGLTLSRENTRLRPEYEDVLRFYGFDLSSIEQEANVTVSVEDSSNTTTELPTSADGNSTSLPAENATETTNTTASDATMTTVMTTLTDGAVATSSPDAGTQTTSIAPTPSNTSATSESVADAPIANNSQASSSTLTMAVATVTGDQASQTPPTVAAGISNNATGVESNVSTNGSVTPNMSTDMTMTSVMTVNDVGTQAPSTLDANTVSPTVASIPTSTMNSSTAIGDASAAASTIFVNVVSTNTPITGATSSTAIASSLIPATEARTTFGNASAVTVPTSLGSVETPTSTPTANSSVDTLGTTPTIDLATTTPMVPETNGTSSGFVGGNSTVANSTLANPAVTSNQTAASLADANTVPRTRRKKSASEAVGSDLTDDRTVKGDESMDSGPTDPLCKRRARSPRGYFTSYPDEGIWMQDLNIWKSYGTASDSSIGGPTSEMSFLVNGRDVSSVSASKYIAVLPFAYFPSLNAVALEFPLDDPRYNIILLMPTDRTDTHRLARDLSGKSLRWLRKRLQPTWVRATIPSFMLRGFVTLTSFLQRLGILDVFEPRVADLSPMTADLGVYARDVQQSIGVNIRNYMRPDRTHSRNGLFERAGPVPFTALHPFIYFIVDTETSVSLIAGRVEDPLNSRIL